MALGIVPEGSIKLGEDTGIHRLGVILLGARNTVLGSNRGEDVGVMSDIFADIKKGGHESTIGRWQLSVQVRSGT